MKSFSTLQIALAVSVAAHGGLLTLRLVDPQRFDRIFQDSSLDVILVNAKSAQAPSNAQALAQFALDGGGQAAAGRSTSPLPTERANTPGTANNAQQELDAMQQQQTLLLAQVKEMLAALPPPNPRPPNPLDPAQAQQQAARLRLQQSAAAIEKQVFEENQRPKKHLVGPSTQETVYALYYNALKQKIEDKGTQSFPQAGGTRLYGELGMLVTVQFDGSVAQAEVVHSSGNAALDRQAQSIVRAAAPFGAFNPAIRQQWDQLVFAMRMKFTKQDGLGVDVQSAN